MRNSRNIPIRFKNADTFSQTQPEHEPLNRQWP
jgi:hypothetical protein